MSNRVTILATREPEFLEQYVALRSRMYLSHYPHLPSNFGHLEPDDVLGDVVLAIDSDRVVGGARLNYSTPDCRRRLPMESDTFNLGDVFPDLDAKPYAEISRLAVSIQAATDGSLNMMLARELCCVAARQGIDTLFSMCPPAVVRINRRNANHCGIGFQHCSRLAIPNPFAMSMTLCIYTGILAATT